MRIPYPANSIKILILSLIFPLVLLGCSPAAPNSADRPDSSEVSAFSLPDLEPVELDGASLQVIATTSIIGDVVAQVGGDAIALTTLIGPGRDPHSYTPTALDLASVSSAHVIFINGWGLEEALAEDLEQIAAGVPVVTISANIEPLVVGEDEHDHEAGPDEAADEHDHTGADPHVWFSIPNVEVWVANTAEVLSALDPTNTIVYESNAGAYQAELWSLAEYAEAELAKIPADRRFLVTNHDSLRYLARDYDFTILGTVIPAASTVAEPSAQEIAGLIEEMEAHHACTIFTETTVSASLAQTIADELENCSQVQVLQLYTGALGPPGSGADTYLGMFRHTVMTITSGLK